MMNSYEKLNQLFIDQKNNLCVGLDPDYTKLPQGFEQNPDGIYNFIIEIINATKDLAIAYKFNFAFYEAFGAKGLEVIERVLPQIPSDKFIIADGKRSDIGNSSQFYAEAVYKHFPFDAATLNPLMGADSLEPFFKYTDKLNFVLALTSNPGSKDFLNNYNFFPNLFREIIRKFTELYSEKNLGFVAAGIKPEETMNVRLLAPNYILLIPGIGAQGGNLKQIHNKNMMPAIFNVSRDIIFPENADDYFKAVHEKAIEYTKLLAL